jgi:N-methylhydantoinase B
MKHTNRRRRSYDPVTLAVHWNRLIAIVDEASATLLRTAFSRIVTDAWDFTCALFDEDGQMIAQPTQGLPSFIGSLATAVQHFRRAYPPASLSPGDTLVTNDPWIGTSQLNDMVFVSPIFHRGRIVGYATNISHSPDVGGRLLSADARELFDVLTFRTPGGGGYGDPRERTSDRLAEDRSSGLVGQGG